MADKKQEPTLKEKATTEMNALVEQHNELVQVLQDSQGRLAEVKQQIVEKQGYLKALEDCGGCE